MRDLKSPWYIHVSPNDDVEVRNSKGEIVMTYYYYTPGEYEHDPYPGADVDVICAGAEALCLLKECVEGGQHGGDWEERVRALLHKVDQRLF